MRIFVTGGTGLVGSRLMPRLLERGDQVVVLTRRPQTAQEKWGERVQAVAGDLTQRGDWADAVRSCDAAINLAGAGVFDRRWSAAYKDAIRTSRVLGTENLVNAMMAAGTAKTLVSASAIGYYGPHGDEELTEQSAPGTDFLAQVCVDWEKAALSATSHGVRVAVVRVGVVLDRDGGALQKMLSPFKMFVGGPIGSGRQYLSWVHVDDLVGLILFVLERAEAQGPYNGTAPQPLTNKEFSQTLGRVLHRPSFLPAPTFALRIMLGEVAGLITQGQRVLPRRALAEGYVFRFPELLGALRNLLQ
jgi:uncharacterized protein